MKLSAFLTTSVLLLLVNLIAGDKCHESFKNKCHCGFVAFPRPENGRQYLVNCTNTRFTSTDMLENLPEETEVLIFTGNFLNELTDNVIGLDSHDALKYIDFSNNHITQVDGQSFHRVKNVHTLILNYNSIEITQKERPRMFSNFKSLTHLHLTDAFTDKYNASSYYLLVLEDIFIESQLNKLERLHLEQNEIWSIGTNESIFCPLRSLQHIYLGDNKLQDMDFKIKCLEKLSYIDLKFNMITRLSDDAMKRLDAFQSNRQSLRIDMKDNPFVCDCRSASFIDWIHNTKVMVGDRDSFVCLDGFPRENIDKQVMQISEASCPGRRSSGYSSGTVGFLTFLVVALVFMVIALIFYQRKRITTLVQPLVDDFTRQMGYRGLASEEAPKEVNV